MGLVGYFNSTGFTWFWNTNDYGESTGRRLAAEVELTSGIKLLESKKEYK